MWTYKHRIALCCLGVTVLACGEPATQPTESSESVPATPLLSTAVTGTWRLMPSLVPARAGIAASVTDKSIVVVGGYVFGKILSRVDAYNVETRTWRRLRPLPEPRRLTGATTINGKIYVAGGMSVIDDPADPHYAEAVVHKSLFVYDPETNTWTRKADMPRPGVALQAAVLGRLYAYVDGSFLAYSPRIDRWVRLQPPPSRHDFGVMAAAGGKVYLTSGLTQATVNPYNKELDVYDPATRAWTVKSPMRLAAAFMTATPIHGKLWLTSGPSEFVTTPDGQLYLSNRDVQVYDPVSDQWKDGPLMLKDSKEGASVYVGGRLYVLGGTDMDGHVTSVVQALSASY
jgi:N-acetylneuraminic acid mutarotase